MNAQTETKKPKKFKKNGKAKLKQRLIDAALVLAQTQGWRDLSMAEIAATAGVPLSEALTITPSKTAILSAFSQQIDAQVLNELDDEASDEPARDRLFDVLMSRYDLLWPYRPALRAILGDLPTDPGALLAAASPALESVQWMLEAADLDTSGVRGALRVRAVAVIYAANLRIWLNEENQDMAKTMADLDRRLRRVESLMEQATGMVENVSGLMRASFEALSGLGSRN
ncbi:MAG: TetR/AcrR family transcriptional regulator [Candidatus Phaeomarinobacter sp.]